MTRRARAAVTLVEAMLALLIVLLGLTPVFALLSEARREGREATRHLALLDMVRCLAGEVAVAASATTTGAAPSAGELFRREARLDGRSLALLELRVHADESFAPRLRLAQSGTPATGR